MTGYPNWMFYELETAPKRNCNRRDTWLEETSARVLEFRGHGYCKNFALCDIGRI